MLLTVFLNELNPPLVQRIWHIENNIYLIPKCPSCHINNGIFNKKRKHYGGCSAKCVTNIRVESTIQSAMMNHGVSNKSKLISVKDKIVATNTDKYGHSMAVHASDIKDKTRNTMIERYGVENPAKNPALIAKAQQTSIIKYGFKYGVHSVEGKRKQLATMNERYGGHSSTSMLIKRKIISTVLKRYGVENIMHDKSTIEKLKTYFLDKYGVENPAMIDDVRSRIGIMAFSKNTERLERVGCTKISCNGRTINITGPCGHEFNILNSTISWRLNMGHEICTICNPIISNTSVAEREVLAFVKSIFFDDVISGYRGLGKELDIYIPSKNIAIEFNGLYYHSDIHRDKNYHLEKTRLCNDNGIRLYHIWEDEWRDRRDVVKSHIINMIGVNHRKIYARKCVIKNISRKVTKKFIEKYHIQGYKSHNWSFGMFYGDELVEVMTFQNKNPDEIELNRLCSSCSVIGGFSKLLKYALLHIKPMAQDCKIVSFCDISKFGGESYETVGFTKVDVLKPDYKYTDFENRYNKRNFRLLSLRNMGIDTSGRTEKDIVTYDLGLSRIYDCGMIKYEMSIFKLQHQ